MKRCDKHEDLIARFLHGELLLQEKEELERHLAVCDSCENLYREISDLDRLLREMPEKLLDPPSHLLAKIMASLPDAETASFARHWGRWAAAAGAVAACALLAFALFRGGASRESRVASSPSPSGSPAVTAPPAPEPVPSPPKAQGKPSPPRAVASAPKVKIIREVKIYFYYPPAEKVAVTGDFNGWNPDGVPLKAAGKPGLWEATLRLRPGAYSYNFIVDGNVLVPDPNAPDQAPDGFGGTNSIMLVKGGDAV